MTLKWMANLIVILGCGYLGVVFASRADVRIRQLDGVEAMLRRLSFNIGFLSLPFAEALQRAAKCQPDAVGRMFEQVGRKMADSPEFTPEVAFSKTAEHSAGLCLKKAELEILREFMAHAGRGDRQHMLDGIRMTEAKLKLIREGAITERERDGKLWKGMGFLAGILVVLLLF